MDFSHYEISQQTPTPTKPSEDQSPVNVTERIKALKIDLKLPKPFIDSYIPATRESQRTEKRVRFNCETSTIDRHVPDVTAEKSVVPKIQNS